MMASRNMMDDFFKIFVEQLKGGVIEEIESSFDPDFLDCHDRELKFQDPVLVKGQAFVAEKDLILELDISTQAILPCSICNEWVKIPIEISRWIHDVPLKEIKTGIYLFKDPLRETILLETPAFAECCQGNCPERERLKQYFKPSTKDENEGYQPFLGLKE